MSQTKRTRANRLVLTLFDMLGLLAAWHGTVGLRLLLNPYMRLRFSRPDLYRLAPPLTEIIVLFLAAEVWLKVSRPGRTPKVGELFFSVVESVMLASTLTIVATFFSRQFGAELSRSFVLLFVPVSFVTLILGRYAALLLIAALGKNWLAPERVAVLGNALEARRIVDRVRNAGEPGISVAGIILPEHGSPGGLAIPVPVLGTTRRLAELINHTRLDRIIIVRGGVTEREADRCGAISQRMGVVLSHAIPTVSPQVRAELGDLCGMTLIDLKPIAFTRRQELAKRCFDIVTAAAGLIVLAPLMLVVAALIKLTSKGPVLHRSSRVGRGGRHFTFVKFRSMYHDRSDRRQVAAANEKSGHIFKIRNDPRVTPLGSFLRKYSIDELPQLLNILRGDMSLVGPRPLPASDLDPDGQSRQFAFWSEQRSRVLPGLTGLWQIRGRSNTSFKKMIELDVEYIRSFSLGLDLRILFETPLVVFTGRGAY